MALKRRFCEEEDGCKLQAKRCHLSSSIGLNYGISLQESVSSLEPIIRKWVQEAVGHALGQFQRPSYNQVECTKSRSLQLQFHSFLPPTIFTGSKIVSMDGSPIKVVLCDSTSGKIISDHLLSSVKVHIVVLDGDMDPDDQDDWTKKEFENKMVKNREGKRPLVTGELTIPLQDGVGYIGEICFTDNSSWIRCGKFRLGAKVASSDATRIREAMSNPFKVKDHRGESYQKHYPPSLDDEVWRLEKIAKEGVSHRKLTQAGICCVRDLLRLYATNHMKLRHILQNASDKTWKTIIAHATKCTLDDQKYLYKTTQGSLLFDSIYKVVGVTFDGETYHSVNNLNIYQMGMVEDLKQHAYTNMKDWVLVPVVLANSAANTCTSSNLGFDGVNFHEEDQQGMEVSTNNTTISPPYTNEVERDGCCFELGESSHPIQAFNPTFRNSFGMGGSPGGFYTGGHHSWSSGEDYMGQHLSNNDPPMQNSFLVTSSAWQENGMFIDDGNHEIDIFSSNSGVIPSIGKLNTSWCIVLTVVKWRMLVKRNVAARKWILCYNYI